MLVFLAQSDPFSDTITAEKIQEPRRFRVLLHNDNYTTMDFVVRVLTDIFHKSAAEAVSIMLHVHEQGVGECGVYAQEIAETKVQQVSRMATAQGYPLRASIEEV